MRKPRNFGRRSSRPALPILASTCVVVAGCGSNIIPLPCAWDPASCADTDGSTGGTAGTAGTAGTGGGNGDDSGGADDTGDGGAAAPFQHRAFIAQHEEYNGAAGSADAPIAGVYNIPNTCALSDTTDDASALAMPLGLAGWDVRLARDAFLFPQAEHRARPENFGEPHDAFPFNVFFDSPTDHLDADAYDLAIFSGHADLGAIHSNQSINDDPGTGCTAFHQESIRLGMYCGMTTKVAAYAGSCVATIDEGLCPLPLVDPMNQGQWDDSWPPLCFDPLFCTLGRSAVGLTLAFVDSPHLDHGQQESWWSLASQIGAPGPAWILSHALDEATNVPNQPAVFVQVPDVGPGGNHLAATERFYYSNINSGYALEQMLPDVPFYMGFSWIAWDGTTTLTNELGEPIMFGVQNSASDCGPNHADICSTDPTEPDGASPYDCQMPS